MLKQILEKANYVSILLMKNYHLDGKLYGRIKTNKLGVKNRHANKFQ